MEGERHAGENRYAHSGGTLCFSRSGGVSYIFGLPEREQLALTEPDCAVKALDGLIEKGILTKEGKLTRAAFFMTEMLKQYQESKEYVRFNNVMCAFLPDDEERVIVLTEIGPAKSTHLTIWKNGKFICRSFQKFPF